MGYAGRHCEIAMAKENVKSVRSRSLPLATMRRWPGLLVVDSAARWFRSSRAARARPRFPAAPCGQVEPAVGVMA